MHRERILIVDDDRLLQNSLTAILRERHQPLVAGSGEEALRLLQRTPVDLVLLDVRLPAWTASRPWGGSAHCRRSCR